MSDYKMNTPIIVGKETLWYRTLRAIYLANKPLRKKEWLDLAKISYSDEDPLEIVSEFGCKRTKWSYRHWRGLYPSMFKHFQWFGLVHYDCKTKTWHLHRPEYKMYCKNLGVKP